MTDSRDEYLRRCSAEDILDEEDHRRLGDVPGCDAIADAANAGRVDEAIKRAEGVKVSSPDSWYPHYWLATLQTSAYNPNPRLELARSSLVDGLQHAKSKSRLCGKLGEVEWQAGDLVVATEWWIKSVRLQLRQVADNYTPFVYLMHLAILLGFHDLGRRLDAHVRKIQVGGIQLDSVSQSRMLALLQSVKPDKVPWLAMAVKDLETVV